MTYRVNYNDWYFRYSRATAGTWTGDISRSTQFATREEANTALRHHCEKMKQLTGKSHAKVLKASIIVETSGGEK